MILEPYILALLAELHKDKNLQKIIVCKDEAEAQKFQKTLLALAKNFLSEDTVLLLPGFIQTGVFKYESAKKIIAERLNVAHLLSKSVPRLIIASVSGLTRSFPGVAWLENVTINLKRGGEYDFDTILSELDRHVYTEVKQVEEVGEYAVRGSIIDVWTPGQRTPVRLEFVDDTLEKIKLFRVHDQKSFSALQEVSLLPAREFVWPLPQELELRAEQFNTNILKQKVEGVNRSNLLEDLKSSVPFPGIDDLSYFFSQSFSSFLDVVRNLKNSKSKFHLECFSSLADIKNSIKDIETVYSSAWQTKENKNTLLGKIDSLFSGMAEFKKWLEENNFEKRDYAEKRTQDYLPPDTVLDFFSHKETFHARAIQLKKFLQKNIVKKIVVATKNKDSALEMLGLLTKYFPELEMIDGHQEISEFSFQHFIDDLIVESPSPITTTILDIDGCFFIPSIKAFFISENILRGRTRSAQFEDFSKKETSVEATTNTQSQSAQNSQIFFSSQFSDFSEGDLVVHVQHGICRFRGLATVKIENLLNDFLVLEFSGNDKIYIPVSKLNLVQKYVGASSTVELDSLKSKSWDKRRERVKKDVEQLAKKLIEHHAKQVMTPGTPFSKIGEDYIAFEDAFPYDDTPDQHKVTQEIMADMSLPKAMDRLLCGDVGFGKTEVAMRACYRAVLDGKQVAWLVPTTVLAHQHLRTLLERFTPFGVNVAMLDRSSSSSAKTLEKIKKGEIDILIGTHRILAQDIKFRDLGLLVIDEEQHFGVMQKEKIKTMSYGIDVLTLTATPIPRTLQMALLGIRELSLLTTPPKSRLATKTFVCPFEDKTIIDAIKFEISRGGQIFYVHNRVEELESIRVYLSELIPTLRIAVGHGKMLQNDLEKTIVEFLDGKFDLFLCTTIVEAGIDMPNVNTILVQNADSLGLAQLYQLRGRVGRRSTRGYAYFLVPVERFTRQTDGMKRLEILQEHQELGSGFVIASQDLEMRGAGEILGDEQSGKVSEIGLETYLQMLDDAIKHLGGIRIERKTEVELQIPLTTQIPEHYIEGARARLLMYRRFFGARDESALINLIQECEDRFGKLPEEMQDLIEISRIRRLLLTFGAVSFTVGEDNSECRLDSSLLQSTDEHAEAFVKRVLDLCNRYSKNMRITQDGRLIFPIKRKQFVQNKHAAIQELKRLLSLLAG